MLRHATWSAKLSAGKNDALLFINKCGDTGYCVGVSEYSRIVPMVVEFTLALQENDNTIDYFAGLPIMEITKDECINGVS